MKTFLLTLTPDTTRMLHMGYEAFSDRVALFIASMSGFCFGVLATVRVYSDKRRWPSK